MMDLAEIRFIRKTFIKERGSQVFRKFRLSSILWEPFRDSAPPRAAVGYSETNFQLRNEIHHAVEKGNTSFSLFKGWTKFSHSLKSFQYICTAWSQHRYKHHRAVANIEERSLRRFQQTKQNFNWKNFAVPLATGSNLFMALSPAAVWSK